MQKKRTIFIVLLLLSATNAFADKILQCDRYTVKEGEVGKQDRTVFTFTFSPDKQSVIYKKISGPDWFMISGTVLQSIWKSKDDLRAVVYWVNSDYEKVDTVWHPLHILDIDFSKPRYEWEHYGGFSDFDTRIYFAWKQECKRTN